MKIKIYSFLILAVSYFILFSFVHINRTYQTECLAIETDGYLTIKIWDTKQGAKYQFQQAQKDVIHALLYSGFSGNNACATQPQFLSNPKEQDNFKSIEKRFFASNGQWALFTRASSTKTTLPVGLGEKKWKVYQVSVSKNELRKYLEDQKIIKSLSHGF